MLLIVETIDMVWHYEVPKLSKFSLEFKRQTPRTPKPNMWRANEHEILPPPLRTYWKEKKGLNQHLQNTQKYSTLSLLKKHFILMERD